MALLLASTAGAQMLGQTMDGEWVYPSFGATIEQHTFVVSSGVELPAATIINDYKFDIDLDADTIEFQFNATSNWGATSFNGWLFRDTNGTLPQITGYSIDAASAGVNTAAVVTGYNDDECWANFAGMSVAGGGEWIRLKVHFAPTGPSLSSSGSAGGAMTFSCTNFAPGEQIAVVYGPAGSTSGTIACGPVTVGLFPLNYPPISALILLTADGAGSAAFSQTVPQAGVGLFVQAVGATSCGVSNTVTIQ